MPSLKDRLLDPESVGTAAQPGYSLPQIVESVREDLEEGRLKPLAIEDVPPGGLDVPMSAVWQTKSPPGPAGRWFIERLKEIPLSNSVPKPRIGEAKKRRSRR